MKNYEEPINIDKVLWLEIIRDCELINDTVEEVFLYLLKCTNFEARASEIAEEHKVNYQLYNTEISLFAKRVLEKYPQISPPVRDNGIARCWHIPFCGHDEDGRFPWSSR